MERLQQEEQRMKSRESQVENALLTKIKSKFGNKSQYKKSKGKSQSKSVSSSSGQSNAGESSQLSGQLKCYKCGKRGHQKRECHGKLCQEYIDYCKIHYKCNNCHENGHFAKECPKNDKNSFKSFISIGLSSAAIDRITNDIESWYKDSGASHHMTRN